MSEFKNRISAQRKIVQAVNRIFKSKEELFGLSSKSIKRWSDVNEISNESRIVNLLHTASEKLFFLANKSQEQVTEDYKITSNDLLRILNEIESL